jgi:hypothetical protein
LNPLTQFQMPPLNPILIYLQVSYWSRGDGVLWVFTLVWGWF